MHNWSRKLRANVDVLYGSHSDSEEPVVGYTTVRQKNKMKLKLKLKCNFGNLIAGTWISLSRKHSTASTVMAQVISINIESHMVTQ